MRALSRAYALEFSAAGLLGAMLLEPRRRMPLHERNDFM
jgi:hypothetical protein